MLLARLIEGEIIPRLLLAHRTESFAPVLAERRIDPHDAPITAAEAAAFVTLVLNQEVHALLAEIEALLARGIIVEDVYLQLLAPAARSLGEMWEDDLCDFVDVTMGLWRLQQVVHEIAARMPSPAVAGGNRRAFFTVVPGDQHSFGLVMIEEFFRRAGWSTWSAPAPSEAELTDLVGRQWFELIGFTVTCEAQLDHLPAIIRAVRRASKNPAVGVMVGGRVFSETPGLAAQVGADATAADGKQAVAKAEMLVEFLANGPPTAARQRG